MKPLVALLFSIIVPWHGIGAQSIEDEALFPVCVHARYGYIDRHGKLLVEPQFLSASEFSEGLARVSIDSRWGFIDKNGKIVIEPRFLNAESFSEGMAAVGVMAAKKDDIPFEIRVGYINKAGQMVVPPRFSFALGFSEGLAPVIIGGRMVRTT